MQPRVFALLLFSIGMGVIGQFFFKSGMNQIVRQHGPVAIGPKLVMCFFYPPVFVGLCCYGIATVTWLAVLQKAPLSLCYPMLSLGYIVVVLMGKFVFKEQFSLAAWIGVILICAGVALIGAGMAPKSTAAAHPAVAMLTHFPPE